MAFRSLTDTARSGFSFQLFVFICQSDCCSASLVKFPLASFATPFRVGYCEEGLKFFPIFYFRSIELQFPMPIIKAICDFHRSLTQLDFFRVSRFLTLKLPHFLSNFQPHYYFYSKSGPGKVLMEWELSESSFSSHCFET
jgi:hypothetical protein